MVPSLRRLVLLEVMMMLERNDYYCLCGWLLYILTLRWWGLSVCIVYIDLNMVLELVLVRVLLFMYILTWSLVWKCNVWCWFLVVYIVCGIMCWICDIYVKWSGNGMEMKWKWIYIDCVWLKGKWLAVIKKISPRLATATNGSFVILNQRLPTASID